MIWVGVLGIIGRLVASWMSDTVGRHHSGFLIGMGGPISLPLAGYWHDVYIGTVSVFFLFIVAQRFFGDAGYAIIGSYRRDVAEPAARRRHGLQLWHREISARPPDRSG